MDNCVGEARVRHWLAGQGMEPFPFQAEVWRHFRAGRSGMLNAPTGSGKTYALLLGLVSDWMDTVPDWERRTRNGLLLLWITPLKALATDLQRAMQEACGGIGLPWEVGLRSGDTTAAERKRQQRNQPEILVTTPESLHLLLSRKDHADTFRRLRAIVVDEWHELMGSKRGVLTTLAISRLQGIAGARTEDARGLRTWGISATIGNLPEAVEVLHGKNHPSAVLVRSNLRKTTHVHSLLPAEAEQLPWAGHLGLQLVDRLYEVVAHSRTTLLFTNTRGQAERWYHALLDAYPDLAGQIALHHGSIDRELRQWVEKAIGEGLLKAVVTTSSLDLGVDFRPVDTVVQVGSPKGVDRFLQRAGRSGHTPHEASRIYFLPTHSLELAEAAALQVAIREDRLESRQPPVLAYDVLVQYLCTLACGTGFRPEAVLPEIRSTHCFQAMPTSAWEWVLSLLTTGGSLHAYEEFRRLVRDEDGSLRMTDRKSVLRHRLHIGTIVSDTLLQVKYLNGGHIGTLEEWFVAKLKPGDVFHLAGRTLAFVHCKEMTAYVRRSKARNGKTPSWLGGRIPLSSSLGDTLRTVLQENGPGKDYPEIKFLAPLLALQQERSLLPGPEDTLAEYIRTRDGYHLFVYPFEGRLVHEVMAALVAYRLSRRQPISFSMAMNDYGFELMSDRDFSPDPEQLRTLFRPDGLLADIQASINAAELARRKFRDIAVIAGLVFQGYPGSLKQNRQLQSSAALLFNVFTEYDPDNLLLAQAYQEVFDQQLEEARLRLALQRITDSRIRLTFPARLTPFSFPIKVDSLRQHMSSEKLAARILTLQRQSR